ncbi:hypothetical protein BASA50_010442 [Batrachochytrium salamandrivorans]|uniref:Ubiquitin-like domain-containing protein n=1 Tax=Batrachochytrium salamandrivorans TaxID=1357716 RepID=A0ABQ8EYG3_9FUNG|nr:hypothetical protein BASA50_010442 [Batrachochytrium salamandrivorans]
MTKRPRTTVVVDDDDLPLKISDMSEASQPSQPSQSSQPSATSNPSRLPKPSADFDFFDLGGKRSVSRIRRTVLDDVDRTAAQRRLAFLLEDPDDDTPNASGLDLSATGILGDSASLSINSNDAGTHSGPHHDESNATSTRIREVSLTPPPVDLSAESQASLDEMRRNLKGLHQDAYSFHSAGSNDILFSDSTVQVPSSKWTAESSSTTAASTGLLKIDKNSGADITIKIEHRVWSTSEAPPMYKPFKTKVSKNHRIQQLLNLTAHRSNIPESDLVLSYHNVKLFPLSFVSESGVRDGDTLVSYTLDDFNKFLDEAPKQSILNSLHLDDTSSDNSAIDTQEDSFTVQIRLVSGITKVRVNQKTTLLQIAEKLGNISLQFEFDGERLEHTTSMENAGIEPLDMIEAR